LLICLATAAALQPKQPRLRTAPFEPRGAPRLRRPHFDGWCARATDQKTGASSSIIVGCFSPGRGRYAKHLVIVAARLRAPDGNWVDRVDQQLYDDCECSLTVTKAKGPNFRFEAPSGFLQVAGSELRAKFELDGVASDIATHTTTPWRPEGWLGSRYTRWLLPCRYEVQCTRSPGTADVAGGDATWRGDALVHAEAQYGSAFPRAWRWIQATDEETTLVATGGLFVIGPVTTRTWLCRYEVAGEVWSFRTTDPRTSATEESAPPRDDRPGTLRVVFRRKFRGETRTLELAATAPEATFSTPLYVPTRTGFARNPGSRESFAASVTATASVEGAIVDERTFEGACLEFGGVE